MNPKDTFHSFFANPFSNPALYELIKDLHSLGKIKLYGITGYPMKYEQWKKLIQEPSYYTLDVHELYPSSDFLLVTRWNGLHWLHDTTKEEPSPKIIFSTSLYSPNRTIKHLEKHSHSLVPAFQQHHTWLQGLTETYQKICDGVSG